MPRRDVSIGALRFAITEPSLREHLTGIRPRTWFIGGVLAVVVALVGVPAVAIGGYLIEQVRGVVTEEVTVDGTSETVHWKEYPGVADLDAKSVLSGPSLEEGLRNGDAMIAEIQEALTAEFGLGWAERPATPPEAVFSSQNQFGGDSMLYGINLPEAASTTSVTEWEHKQRVLAITDSVLAKYGFGDVSRDQERTPTAHAEAEAAYGSANPADQTIVAATAFGPAGQWFNVMILDSSNDTDGQFAKDGWDLDSINLFYGANALLPEASRAEFEKRLEPFAGYALPQPLED